MQAIKQSEITYRTVNDEIDETPFMTKTVLKGCRENSLLSNKKKAQFKKVEDRVIQVSKDPFVREEAKEDGALDPDVTPAGPGDGDQFLNGDNKEDFLPIVIAYINCVGQTKLPISKQLEIQSFVCTNKVDILNLQECRIDDDTFSQCGYLTSNYNLFSNNKPDDSHYGTASLVRSDIEVKNVHTDNDGRIFIFDAAGSTWGNFYLPSGSDGNSRAKRENYFSEIIPQLMVRRLAQGAAGGDFNSIVSLSDSNKNPQSKVSPLCRNLVRAFSWTDSFRVLQPRALQYSRHNRNIHHGDGASRIDRSYH